jgi:predicted TIM-barrel enzyme
MAKKFTRKEITRRLKETISEGKPILVACCGAGIVAKFAEVAGSDIITTACTSKSRLMGLPTYPLGDPNEDMMKLFPEISNVVKDTPIIASLDAHDPRTLDLEVLINQVAMVGYSGVLNYPTFSDLFGNQRRFVREAVGLGFSREIEMMKIAMDHDLFTIAYAFNPEDAKLMAEAHVDCIVAHVGATGGGTDGTKTGSLKQASEYTQKIIDTVKVIDRNIICLGHGGPFATPEDTRYLYEHTEAVGYVGASSIERIPIEKAVRETVAQFKSIPISRNKKIAKG